MQPQQALKQRIGTLTLLLVVSAVFSHQAVQAREETEFTQLKSVKVIKFSKGMKVRGFQVRDGVYMGQAKIAGKYGLGIVVDRKSYSWGINNRGIAIQKSF